jgi:hypothetical protein
VKLTIHLHLLPRPYTSTAHTDSCSVTLTKPSRHVATEEAQEMKVRLLLFLWQNEQTSAYVSSQRLQALSRVCGLAYTQAAIVTRRDSDRTSSLWAAELGLCEYLDDRQSA